MISDDFGVVLDLKSGAKIAEKRPETDVEKRTVKRSANSKKSSENTLNLSQSHLNFSQNHLKFSWSGGVAATSGGGGR